MKKYLPLYLYLCGLGLKESRWQASFKEIELILGCSLPDSAKMYQAWWANQKHSVRCQSWIKAGWKASKPDFQAQTILFLKDKEVSFSEPKTKQPEEKTQKPMKLAAQTLHAWDTDHHIEKNIRINWNPLGAVSWDPNKKKLVFPVIEKVPGLYRFWIRHNDQQSFYIGESSNLKRRFNNYRSCGKTQATSIRISKMLENALLAGAEISVSIVTEKAWLEGQTEPLDLSSKTIRCMLENLTILTISDPNVRKLNKAD